MNFLQRFVNLARDLGCGGGEECREVVPELGLRPVNVTVGRRYGEGLWWEVLSGGGSSVSGSAFESSMVFLVISGEFCRGS